MMSRSGGLKPRAVAGKPSVTRLTHSSWTGISASGMPSAAVRKILRRKGGQMEAKETMRGPSYSAKSPYKSIKSVYHLTLHPRVSALLLTRPPLLCWMISGI